MIKININTEILKLYILMKLFLTVIDRLQHYLLSPLNNILLFNSQSSSSFLQIFREKQMNKILSRCLEKFSRKLQPQLKRQANMNANQTLILFQITSFVCTKTNVILMWQDKFRLCIAKISHFSSSLLCTKTKRNTDVARYIYVWYY